MSLVEEATGRTPRLHPTARPTRKVIARRTASREGSTASGKRGPRRVVVEGFDGQWDGSEGADGEGEGVGSGFEWGGRVGGVDDAQGTPSPSLPAFPVSSFNLLARRESY